MSWGEGLSFLSIEFYNAKYKADFVVATQTFLNKPEMYKVSRLL